MKFTVNAKMMKDEISKLKIIMKRSYKTYGDMLPIELSASNNKLHFRTIHKSNDYNNYDVDTWLDCDVTEEGSFVLTLGNLIIPKTVKAKDSLVYNIQAIPGNNNTTLSVTIENFGLQTTGQLLPAETFASTNSTMKNHEDTAENEKSEIIGFATSQDLVEALKSTSFAMSDDDARSNLKSVYLEFTEDMIMTTSTNGHIMSHYSNKFKNNGSNRSYLIHDDAVRFLEKTLDNKQTVISFSHMDRTDEYGHTTTNLVIASDTLRLVVTQGNGMFPDWKQVLPTSNENYAIFKVSELQERLTIAKQMSNAGSTKKLILGTIFAFDKNSCTISVQDRENNILYSSKLEAQYPEYSKYNGEKTFRIAFNADYMLRMLSVANSGYFMINFNSNKNTDPVVISNPIVDIYNSSWWALIMPVRL